MSLHYGFGWIFPLFFMLFWVAFWVFIVSFLWRGWHRWGHERWHHWGGNSSAEGLLADRFARGEIDEEEYNKRLEVLRRPLG